MLIMYYETFIGMFRQLHLRINFQPDLAGYHIGPLRHLTLVEIEKNVNCIKLIN